MTLFITKIIGMIITKQNINTALLCLLQIKKATLETTKQ